MTDYITKSTAHRQARDASIPPSLLTDLTSLSPPVPALPTESLPLPFSKTQPHKPEPTTVYPADNVLSVPSRVLSPEDDAITTTPLSQLLELLSTGKLSSVRCTEAFLRRAVLAHQLTNCATDFFPDLALARAKECDAYLATHGKPIGLLHGLPVSLKDQFHIKGTEMTMGYVSQIGSGPAERNSVITDILLEQGAVVYVRTNVPQSLMRCETHNHIYGRTVSPFNRSFTAGGSSGGEGALVGMHGSPLGLGTDIGGSVRVPSAFNGLWGMRPSMYRIPYEGAANSFLGQESISSVIGPLTHSLEGGGDVHEGRSGGEAVGEGSCLCCHAFQRARFCAQRLVYRVRRGEVMLRYRMGRRLNPPASTHHSRPQGGERKTHLRRTHSDRLATARPRTCLRHHRSHLLC